MKVEKKCMKYNPLISVIVPIYNVGEYIEKCIKSIIEQSYSNLEIILVDDGSTDNSKQICDRYACLDARITIFHKKNGGITSARKAGMSVAQGEYVIWVDGDDWIEKDRIYNVICHLQNERTDMLYLMGYYKDYENSSRIIEEDIEEKSYYNREIVENAVCLLQNPQKSFERKLRTALWSWAIKKELVQRNMMRVDDRILGAEDTLCIYLCFLEACSLKICKERGYHYVQRYTSLSYTILNKQEQEQEMEIFRKQIKIYLEKYKYKVTKNIKKSIKVLYIMDRMLHNYNFFFEQSNTCLFPYSKVKKGSKIIVYGAGRFGRVLINTLRKNTDYEVVLWVDQSTDRDGIEGYVINSIEKIKEVEFDYIVVAVIYEKDAEEIEQKLLSIDIEKDKIARMNIEEINKCDIDY